jgi:hypothetical protein
MTGLKKMMISFVVFGLLLTGAFLAGTLGDEGVAFAQEKGITVRVLLYSGRPDPTYMLEDSQMIGKLKKLVSGAKRLERFDKKSVIPVNIGYKGILVLNPGGEAGLPVQFAVYKGAMEVKDEKTLFFEDTGGEIEKMLFDEAVKRNLIDEVILKRMKKEE